MKPIKQLCKASVFLLAALLSVSACDSAGEGSETTPLTEADPLGGGKMIYTIVRGDNSSKEECDAAVRLRTTLRDTYGIDIAIETDWVKRGENVDDHRFGNEIIIGTTNRNESIAAKEKLNEGTRDQIDYILSRDDEDYIIVSSAGGAEAAVDAFLAEFTKDPTMLTRTPGAMDISEPHVFPLDDVVIGGTSIFDFDAIYCPDTCSKIAQADAASLKSLLFHACGVTLPFVTTAGEGDRLISYYPHTDAEMLETGGFSYAMVPGDSGLILDGCDEYTAACALDLFREDLTAAMEQGGTYTLDTPERILHAPAEDNLILSAWVIGSTPITEEAQFAEIADCGFNQVIISKPTDDQTLYDYCKWMSRQGLRALWHDNQIAQHDDAPAMMEGVDAPYVDAYVTWGHMLRDEPNTNAFEALLDAQTIYEEAHPDKCAFVNLFPRYASEAQLGAPTFEKYVEQFLDTLKPAFTSVDIYPMNVGYIMDSYFQDIDSFVTLCRERDIPYGIYIQSVSFASSKRKPNENDMRWQAYCCLAFGATDIEYFTYRTPDSSTEDFKDALIDRNNQKTESWYGAQKINAELNAFSSEFMTYRNLGAFSVNASSTYHMKFRNQYKDFDAIGKITIEDNAPVLMGAFEKREGEGKAFVCVNGQDPGAFQNPITVTVELTEAKTAVIWQKGEKTTLTPDEKGCISFRLTAGEGVFVQLD